MAALERWRAEGLSRLAPGRGLDIGGAIIAGGGVTAAMEEAQRSACCREHGIFPSDGERWRESVAAALARPEEAGAKPHEVWQDRRQIKELEKETRGSLSIGRGLDRMPASMRRRADKLSR